MTTQNDTTPREPDPRAAPEEDTERGAQGRAWLLTALAFLTALAAGVVFVLQSEQARLLEKQKTAFSMASHHGHALQMQLSRSLSSAYAVAAVLRQGKGHIDNFQSLATELMRAYGSGISALQLAPNGVLRQSVPLAGNEAIIGHDLFRDRARDKEAFLALETRRLTVAGPFNLVQGGTGLVGRLPVFLPDANGQERFWGFACVLIRVPDLIAGSRLARLMDAGYRYEISRIHPDTGQSTVFARSGNMPLDDPIRYEIEVPNGTWTLSIAPAGGWHSTVSLAFESAMALLVSVLIATLIRLLMRQPILLGQKVRQSTRELAASNRQLAEEIRERSETQERLREQVHFIEELLDAIPSPVFYKDTEGRYLGCNRAFEAYIGIPKNELMGKTAYDIAPKELADIYHEADASLYSSGGLQVYDASVVYADGTRHDVVFNKATFSHVDGALGGLVGVMLDITERKAMENTLRGSEARFRHLYDYSPAMMLSVDDHGRVVDVNRQWLAETGYERQETIGEALDALMLPSPGAEARAPFWELKQAQNLEVQFRRKDGSVFDAHIHCAQTQSPCGGRSSLVVAENLTARRRAEERLRTLSFAVEQSPASVEITDTQGKIQYVNRKFCEVTGYAPEEVLGRDPSMLKSGHTSTDDYMRIWDTITGGGTWRGELLNRRKNGEEFWEWASISPLTDGDGQITHFVAVKEDINERKLAERALRDSEQRFRAVVEHASEAILLHDREGRLIDVNQCACDSLGYTREELLTMNVWDFEVRALRSIVEPMWRSLQEGHAVTGEGVHRRKDGTCFPVEVRLGLIDCSGEQLVLALVRDVTERKQTAESLRLAARVFESTTEGIIVTDSDGIIQSVNPAFSAITGYSAEEAVGEHTHLLRSGRHDREFFNVMWTSLTEHGQWQGEVWNRRKNGEAFPCWMNISVIRDEGAQSANYVGIFSDISGIKQTEERLYHLAHYDPLTEVPNRLLFHELLQRSLSVAQRAGHMVGVLFLDLDRFKIINDTLGHDVGDTALRAVAQRLAEVLREGDTVARLGGDEFIVLLPEIQEEKNAASAARKILAALAQPFQVRDQELYITTSIGISLFPGDGQDGLTLIKHADTAMYRAKDQGRNTYQFYTLDMNAHAFERLALEASLRHAVQRDEFVLYYQPQVEIARGRITGAEALLRWQHPELGLVSPAQFIPIAEETGLIVPIGEWVLETACRQAVIWQEEGLGPLGVAVNVSARQFREPNLVDRIAEILAATGLDPTRLEVELTENLVMDNPEAVVLTLQRLKAMGVKIAIDDFGTGYSSLSYLKRFPIDTLKIDRSFVHDILTDADDATITRAIIRLAHSLKLKVVAEGVESAEQMGFLQAEACTEMQGFYFSRPIPAPDFAALCSGKRRGDVAHKALADWQI